MYQVQAFFIANSQKKAYIINNSLNLVGFLNFLDNYEEEMDNMEIMLNKNFDLETIK